MILSDKSARISLCVKLVQKLLAIDQIANESLGEIGQR